MTGYGTAQAAHRRWAIELEVRSVNNRNLKLQFRLPPALAELEPDLDAQVRAHVRRGTVNLNVRLSLLQPEEAVRARPEIVEGVARALEPLREKGLIEGRLTPDAVVAIPGALEIGRAEDLRPADRKLVRDALEAALGALDAMRQREAVHLVRDLRRVLKAMRAARAAIAKRAPDVAVEIRDRLMERVDALLADAKVRLDEATLAREVALLADRADVREELTRLGAHLDEFEALLGKDEDVGRTLEFLAQELLREANTIGSKSSDVTIARNVIALKTGIDRLKEQVANLE